MYFAHIHGTFIAPNIIIWDTLVQRDNVPCANGDVRKYGMRFNEIPLGPTANYG